MRHEVLYQYDLPVEVLDAVPDSEEVFDVLHARSKSKSLIPILLTAERILWAYPETAVVYHIYEMQYVDLVSAKVRMTPALPSTLTITTVNQQKYTFNGIKAAAKALRGALFTVCSQMKKRTGGFWNVSEKKTLLTDEYLLENNPNATGIIFADSDPGQVPDDVFEDGPSPGQGCFETNEEIFSHFPQEEEDVFEDIPVETPHSAYEDADSKVARIVETVQEEIRATQAVPQKKQQNYAVDDSVIYTADSGKANDQWNQEIKGDALVLPYRKVWKVPEAPKQPVYGPEDDDSVIIGSEQAKEKPAVKPGARAKKEPEYSPEDDDSEVYVSGSAEPAFVFPHESRSQFNDSLEISGSIDAKSIDRALEALKVLRDSKAISEEEYKMRSLRLFKEDR